jgi:hypothetical protein
MLVRAVRPRRPNFECPKILVGIEIEWKQKSEETPTLWLAALYPNFVGQELQMNGEYGAIEPEDGQQLAMVLPEKAGTYRTKSPSKVRRDISHH